MAEPTQTDEGWFIETDDGKSGPWASRGAAIAIGKGETMKAQIINNRAIQRKKGKK